MIEIQSLTFPNNLLFNAFVRFRLELFDINFDFLLQRINLTADILGRIGDVQGAVLLLELIDHTSNGHLGLVGIPVDSRWSLRIGQNTKTPHSLTLATQIVDKRSKYDPIT